MKNFVKIKFIFRNKIKKILLFSLLLTIILSVIDWHYQSKFLLFTGKSFGILENTEKEPYYELSYDEKGIPVLNYFSKGGIKIGKQYNPVTISQIALKYYEDYLAKGNENSKRKFISCADWLVENSKTKNNFRVWEYEFPWPYYNLDSGWISGMAEGLGIEVLAKAYQITTDKIYIKISKDHLRSFFIKVENGGVLDIDENGEWWYLEYAQEGKVKPRVLNGFMFSLVALYRYYEITGDEDAKLLFDRGIKGLKAHVQEYDTGKWTNYDAIGTPASEGYHRVHIELMGELYDITKDKTFLNYEQKWKRYTQKSVLDKLKEKWEYFLNNKKLVIGIISFNFELSLLIVFILFYKEVLR